MYENVFLLHLHMSLPLNPRSQAAFFGKLSWNALAEQVLFISHTTLSNSQYIYYNDIPACVLSLDYGHLKCSDNNLFIEESVLACQDTI